MPAVNQDTITQAGLDPFMNEVKTNLEPRRKDAVGMATAASEQIKSINNEATQLGERRTAELKPMRDELGEKARGRPSSQVDLEQTPNFQRPTVSPKELHESFGMLMAASMLVGIASRAPFQGAMTAMGAGMEGYLKGDRANVEESFKTFDKNITAIKQRNDAKREAVDRIVKDYSNDIVGMQQQLALKMAEYDDQASLMALRTKSPQVALAQAYKNIDTIDKAIERNMKDSAQVKHWAEQDKAAQTRAERGPAGRGRGAGVGAEGVGAGTLSGKYATDPAYKGRVDYWAKFLSNGGQLPARFAQSVGKEFASDVFSAAEKVGGGDPNDMIANRVTLRQMNSEAQKIGTQSASVAIAGKELESFIPLAEKAVDAVPRVGWKPINRLIQFGENTWSPEQKQLVIANRAVQTAYAQLIQRGLPTVHSSEEAEKMLQTADSPAVYKAATSQLMKEVKAAEEGLVAVHDDLQKRIKKIGRREGEGSALPAGVPAGSTKVGKTPDGKDVYQSPDGKKWVPD